MNMQFFTLINNLANKNSVLDKVMIFFSSYVPYIFMAMLLVIFAVGIVKNNINHRKAVVSTFVMTLINLTISFIIGSIYYADRPFVHNKVKLLVPHSADASFPSDHATGTMSIALGIKKYNSLISIIFMVLSVIVGFSRVYVGHHYPADILGAYIIVIIINYLYGLVLRDKVESLYEMVENKVIKILKIKQYKSIN